MDSASVKSTARNGAFVVAVICIFSVSFSIISIYSAYEQHHGLQMILKHPFRVTSAIYSVRKDISEMQIRMGRLASHSEAVDVQLVREKILDLTTSISAQLEYVRRYYLGSKEDVDSIVENIHKTYTIQDAILDHAAGKSSTRIAERIEQELSPRHAAIDTTFNKMLLFAENKSHEIFNHSSSVLHRNILFTVLISLLMITITFIIQRIVYKRTKDKEYRDYILKVISENSGTVFILYAQHNNSIEYISPNTQKVVGLDIKTLEQNPRTLLEYCNSEQSGNLGQLFDSSAIRTRMADEYLFKNPQNGDERWILINICPLLELDNRNRYIISIADLTEVKAAQQVLKDALISAQSANKAKSQFFARMSHDIRTPMNAIIGMTTIAATALEDKARLQDCLAKIASSSRHLLMLINDVLDMSKIESGKFAIAHSDFDFADLIHNVTGIIYPQAQAKNQHFELNMVDVNHENLVGDPLRLNQVLINILGNAVKFTPEGGNIHLKICERPEKHSNRVWMYFTISDTGRGMTQAFLERIFLPFEQEHPDVAHSCHSTGLGMAITKNIVSLMHGTITVESRVNKGTTFDVGLSFDVSNSTSPQKNVELDNLKVLVVDDDKGTCEHATLILHRIGVQAEWVLSGNTAVQQVINAHKRNNGYDVVFIDWQMPEMDGIEVTRRIRKHVGPDTLIIIISAYDWTEIETVARQAGANAFIAKPMFQSSLYNTLLTVTKGQKADPQHAKTPPNFSGKRFLLAEDNDINCEIAMEFLKVTGAAIDVARDGQEAVDTFEASLPGTYAAVLMDVQMPVMNGHEATRTIRQSPHPDALRIPIIAMTANAFADDVAAALQSGMNDHIGKPIDIELLFQKLNTWLGSSL